MSSPWKPQPEAVVDKVLKRVELSKMARRLQNRLALAQFKTSHGWEDLAFDTLEPRYEEEIRRKRLSDGDLLSDTSSSSASDLPSYPTRTLMSSPLKAPLFSDALGSGSTGGGHRKRNYMSSFDMTSSLSPSKRLRSSPTAHRSFSTTHTAWKEHHQLAQSSPIKPRRHQHFTTSSGPDVSFFAGTRDRMAVVDDLASPNYAAQSDDDSEDLLPAHSFRPNRNRDSPPSTPPPMRNGNGNARRSKDKANPRSNGEEGADLLLYLAASPSPANPNPVTAVGGGKGATARMQAPSTPPQKNTLLALPSSMMTTPGGGNLNLFSSTPGQAGFDFSDFVNMTPSPAQKPWKTPIVRGGGMGSARTPLSVARRRLTFDDLP